MPNMSYCRFRNTLRDLQDCHESLRHESSQSELDEMGQEEFSARRALVELCIDIAEEFEHVLEEKYKGKYP